MTQSQQSGSQKSMQPGDKKLLIIYATKKWSYHAAMLQTKCTKQVQIIIVRVCHMLPTTITACMTVS